MRHHELDAARAAAMLLGVFFHAAISFMVTPIGWFVQDRSTHLGMDFFTWLCHGFRMPVFFLLSGYFSRLLVEKRGLESFTRQRLKRLLLPLLLFWPPVAASLFFLWRWGRSLAGQPAAQWGGLDVPADGIIVSPAHLWFLWYLLMLALATAVAARWKAPAWVGSLWTGWILGPLAAAGLLYTMRPLEIETPITFVPDLRVLGFYAVFFVQGWFLQRDPERIRGFGRRLLLRAVAALVLLAAMIPLLERLGRREELGTLRIGGALLLAFFSWTAVRLFIGLFVRFMAAERPWVAWVSDSAYWVYLLHLPLCVLLQVTLAPLGWPGPLKYALVSLGTLAVCFATYRLAVRHTWVGTLLNGPRKPVTVAPSPGRL